jgi:hypothetical protein
MDYDTERIPSLPRSGRLAWLSDAPHAPAPTGAGDLAKKSKLLKSVFDSPDKASG